MAVMRDLKCELCGEVLEDVMCNVEDAPECCGQRMAIIPSAPRVAHVLGKGRSQESRQEWDKRIKAKLFKRSLEYDRSPKGKEEIEASLDRLRKRGMAI